MTADQIKVVDFTPGLKVRVLQPGHEKDGRTGTLEFAQSGAAWVRIDGVDYPVRLNRLEAA